LAAFFAAGLPLALALPLAFAFAAFFFAGLFLFFAIDFLLSHPLDA
jgi:hypothetical protein